MRYLHTNICIAGSSDSLVIIKPKDKYSFCAVFVLFQIVQNNYLNESLMFSEDLLL
jgi:hypothetical protein